MPQFNRKKFIIQITGFLIVILIFYFLGRNLYENWEEIKQYKFSLNYFYLILSFIFLIGGNLLIGTVWKKIMDNLEKDNDISYFNAIKIITYSQFGKYLPGKIFIILGQAYLSRHKKISKRNLYLSILLDILLSIVAAFMFSLFLVGFFYYSWDYLLFYIIGLLVIISGLLIMYQPIFSSLINFFLKLSKKKETMYFDSYLNWLNKLKALGGYSLIYLLRGIGFFCLIKAVIDFSPQHLLAIVGFYILAEVLGLVVFFIPSGLGVREGVLVVFLKNYLPLNISILFSLLARVWTIIGELLTMGLVSVLDLFKKRPKGKYVNLNAKRR